MSLHTTYLEQCASLRLGSAWVSNPYGIVRATYTDSETWPGPIIGRWNFFLEDHFPLRSQGGKVSLRALARRVGADQLFM